MAAPAAEPSEKALKIGKLLAKSRAQMDWYRVPQSQFDWSHASMNKEVTNMSIPLCHIHRMEFDVDRLVPRPFRGFFVFSVVHCTGGGRGTRESQRCYPACSGLRKIQGSDC